MKTSTAHRGPDDSGVELVGPIGLAHNRLSIIDLSAESHQPELEVEGCRFHSTGDTEVILHAYRRWGAACLDRFNGMFAFAILDVAKHELFLARDLLGIKPLYYYARGKILLTTLAQRRFGPELFNRPKCGFALPTSYFHGDGIRILKEMVGSPSFRDRELMDHSAVEELIRLTETGVQHLSEAIWVLEGLELWARTFVDKPGVPPS